MAALLLDIEGTICSISFVKDVLYPYFLAAYPALLELLSFPLQKVSEEGEAGTINNIVAQFPRHASAQEVVDHINHLVSNDIKDPVLKAFQGFVWKRGYENGDLVAPLYPDAIAAIKRALKVYIYSSGSIQAQKLLLRYVKDGESVVDLNSYVNGYYDITTAGYKTEASSYHKIAQDTGDVLFLSDNVLEVKASRDAGMRSTIVGRPGNAAVSDEDKEKYGYIESLALLEPTK